MKFELSHKDLSLLQTMLDKEQENARVEIKHSVNKEFKECLEEREKDISSLLERVSTELKNINEVYWQSEARG